MKKTVFHYLLICLLPVAISCLALSVTAQTIPESDISREAFERVSPRLQKEMADKNLVFGNPVFIRIFKESKQLEVWSQTESRYYLFKTYTICDNSGGLGPKVTEGDKQSPEGFYTVTPDKMNPWSRYHLSFNLGFPNEYDQTHNRTGSALMVHGRCSSAGCFAMADYRMEEIYSLVLAAFQNGQNEIYVHIFPFHMTWENMARHSNSPWISFWENLKQGYDYFQGIRYPPKVSVYNSRYEFFTFRKLLFGNYIQTLPGEDNYAGLGQTAESQDSL